MSRHSIPTAFPMAALAAALFVAGYGLTQDTGDADRGAQLYIDHACFACHAYNGTGRRRIIGSPSGLYPENRANTYIANRSSGVLASEEVFITYLRARGDQNPRFPTLSMPHYPASSLSDEDARDIYAYVLIFVDEPPEVDEIPVLRDILEGAEKE